MLNRWEGIGNLGKDPELRYSTGQNQTAICRFSIAVNKGYGDNKKTVWINIVTFGKLAENCQKFLVTGKKVYVAGELDVREYDKQDGSKGYITEVSAKDVEFLSSQENHSQESYGWPPQTGFQRDTQAQSFSAPQEPQYLTRQQYEQQTQADAPPGFQQMAAQEDIPFLSTP